jgi:predicted lipoprotein with Yx(FWY)xxD motif
VYLFKADVGTKSACTGACATAWPLRATGKPTAGTRSDRLQARNDHPLGRQHQVTYDGHPLYLFLKDTKAGQTNGQGVTAFGDAWFALTASGTQATAPVPSSGSSGSGFYACVQPRPNPQEQT